MPRPEILGRFDIAATIVPVDLAAAQTGKRILMSHVSRAAIVIFKAAGPINEDQEWDVQQATAFTGGSVKDLDKVDHWYYKSETTLDGDEAWTKGTQTIASEFTNVDGAGTNSEAEQIVVIEVDMADMDMANGFKYLSINSDGAGGGAQLGCALVIMEMAYPAAPASLPAMG